MGYLWKFWEGVRVEKAYAWVDIDRPCISIIILLVNRALLLSSHIDLKLGLWGNYLPLPTPLA